MKFVRFERIKKNPIYINPDHVVSAAKYNSTQELTRLVLASSGGEDMNTAIVMGAVEDVVSSLANA